MRPISSRVLASRSELANGRMHIISGAFVLPKWSHWRVRQKKKQQQFVACVIKITVRYETSSLPQWIHTIYASSIPPSARLDCVCNASHESTRFIPPQRRSLVGSSAQPKPHGAFANLSSPSAPHVFWGMLAASLVELAHPPPLSLSALPVSRRNHLHFSLKKGAYFLTLICSLWSKFQKG